MQLPGHVLFVIKKLEDSGHPVYLVGGCVRDLLLNRIPKDYDVTTSASLSDIKACFQKTASIGERHGTVAVIIEDQQVEVSTFKSGENTPKPCDGLLADLARRDFTINAMAMDREGNIIDPYGGQEDLVRRVLRSPLGQEKTRMLEDPLRMMRAVRFCACYGFSLSDAMVQVIRENRDELKRVAAERIREELNLILLSDQPSQGIRLLIELGLMQHVIPEVLAMVNFDQRHPRHNRDLLEHTLVVVEGVPARITVRLAALLHDIGKPGTFFTDEKGTGHFYGHQELGSRMAVQILKRLKYDTKTVHTVSILVAEHMSHLLDLKTPAIKSLIVRVGEEHLQDLFALQKADIMASAPPYDLSGLERMQEEIKKILSEKPPITVQDLAVNGYDLIELGYTQGPRIGDVLNQLLDLVLEKPEMNRREILLEEARKYL